MTKIRDSEQLIEMAAKLFGEKGFEDTSLDDIAAALGVRRNSLYYYASSKADLFSMVLVHRLRDLVDQIERIAISDGCPKEKLIAAIRVHMLHTDQYYPESRAWIAPIIALKAQSPADESGPMLQDRMVEIFCGLVKDLIDAGQASATCDPKVIALGVLGVCNWLTRWYRKGGGLSIEAITDMLIQMIIHGVVAEAPIALQGR